MTTIIIREYRRANKRALLKQRGLHFIAQYINYETKESKYLCSLVYRDALLRYHDYVYDIDFVESD